VIEWDITRYAENLPRKPKNSGTKAAQDAESSLRRRYPPRNKSAADDTMSRPCIIVDMHGTILAWYLPGILKDSRQVNSFALSDYRSNVMYSREK
jgi:hypothetical protein